MFSWSLRKQLVANIARCGRQSDASRLAPDSFVDLLLVTDLQRTRGLCKKNRITHFPPGQTVLALHFLPEPQRPELEIWQLLFDLASQAFCCALTIPFATARKHPVPVTTAPDQQDAPLPDCNKFRRFRHNPSNRSLVDISLGRPVRPAIYTLDTPSLRTGAKS